MGYTDERNAQILISVMKANNVKKVVLSPGTCNMCFAGSVQSDPFFEIWSAPDERSAAYIACGIAAESGECVAINCTGATSSRNYMPAMTEAFYRKLPILVVTSSKRNSMIGHNFDQVTDRTCLPNDVARISVQMPVVHDSNDEWANMIAANKAVLELRRRGGGPVHVNLETGYSQNFSVTELPATRIIKRYTAANQLPKIEGKKIAIMVGAHLAWSAELTSAVERFCEQHDAVVLSDHIGNYRGQYRVAPFFVSQQNNFRSTVRDIDLLIHIGDVTSSDYRIKAKTVWRVNPDGEIRDTFFALKAVFEMEELQFFSYYAAGGTNKQSFWTECRQEEEKLRQMIPELPMSNFWCAQMMAEKMPENSVIHFAIRNSLRAWSFFPMKDSILGFSNTGGFGIDGPLSTVVGAALANPSKLFYCIVGDLAFFYDMNVLGNRHIPENLRILLVNNGAGMEMKFSSNPALSLGSENVNPFVAAKGHYGCQSRKLVEDYVTDLGFDYYSADSKETVMQVIPTFLDSEKQGRPLVFEVFTDCEDEDAALKMLREVAPAEAERVTAKTVVKGLLGESGVQALRKLMSK